MRASSAIAELEAAVESLRVIVEEIASVQVQVGARVANLEQSDFALNRKDYEKVMEGLRKGSPGIPLFT